MASAGFEGSVKIWDIQNEAAQMSYDHLGGAPQALEWNYNGS